MTKNHQPSAASGALAQAKSQGSSGLPKIRVPLGCLAGGVGLSALATYFPAARDYLQLPDIPTGLEELVNVQLTIDLMGVALMAAAVAIAAWSVIQPKQDRIVASFVGSRGTDTVTFVSQAIDRLLWAGVAWVYAFFALLFGFIATAGFDAYMEIGEVWAASAEAASPSTLGASIPEVVLANGLVLGAIMLLVSGGLSALVSFLKLAPALGRWE